MADTKPSVRFALRARTATLHETVDNAFAVFDLKDRGSYAAFLLAHARVLPAVEAALQGLDRLKARGPLLLQDLADLDVLPPADGRDVPCFVGAEPVGALYVIEGSRLGNAMMAKQVPAEWPSRYLGAAHASGEWRDFMAWLDSCGEGQPDVWLDEAVRGAATVFQMFQEAGQAGAPATVG